MRNYLFAVIFLGLSSAGASTLSWQAELGEESSWSRVTYAGTLLTASEESLSHFDFETGELLWQRRVAVLPVVF